MFYHNKKIQNKKERKSAPMDRYMNRGSGGGGAGGGLCRPFTESVTTGAT